MKLLIFRKKDTFFKEPTKKKEKRLRFFNIYVCMCVPIHAIVCFFFPLKIDRDNWYIYEFEVYFSMLQVQKISFMLIGTNKSRSGV